MPQKKQGAREKKQGLPRFFRFTHDSFTTDDSSYSGPFLTSPIKALYNWGFEELSPMQGVAGAFLHKIAERFTQELEKVANLELLREKAEVPLTKAVQKELLSQMPLAQGSENLTEDWLISLWKNLNSCYAEEIAETQGTVSLYLAGKNQKLDVAEKIFFHLVENSKDEDSPFSFMATYSTKNEYGQVTHMPLRYALVEFSNNKAKLRSMQTRLLAASKASPLVNSLVRRGELYRPIPLSAKEAYSLLKAIPAIEDAGVVCRIPDWWKKKSQGVTLSIRLGAKEDSLVGLDSIIGVEGYLSVAGEALTAQEIEMLLEQTDGLALIKGRWIEVDKQKLLDLLTQVELCRGEVTLLEALHINMLSNNAENAEKSDAQTTDILRDGPDALTNGVWLSHLFAKIGKETSASIISADFTAKLRPYQNEGYAWLWAMMHSSFGSCLADDMGLGKTVQVLAYLDTLRVNSLKEKKPNAKVLLIVPSSLLGNWQKECAHFAPKMPLAILHGSAHAYTSNNAFLYITTYTTAPRIQSLQETEWETLVLDEAQAIKNPLAKQTKFIKAIPARHRLAITGTPVENDLTNLWSLFDFLNQGLLGTANEFKDFCRTLTERPEGYARIKDMISPFMLRRLKTDKNVISDLPQKIEIIDQVTLSKKQRVLYKQYVDSVEKKIERTEAEGDQLKRRALVLASLVKLKQICNHPDQFTGGTVYSEAESGKFALLRSLCETIYEKRERVLIFTQFKELCSPLDNFLCGIFGTRGLVLHGGTAIKRRQEMVDEFQSTRYIPYMVISVKAGGTGLTLTNANHVIHFDRWWNPAVENQATDRAFRIGQKKNVIVHKFVCTGTLEEKINELIERKKNLAQNVIGTGSGEKWITGLSSPELKKLFRLEN